MICKPQLKYRQSYNTLKIYSICKRKLKQSYTLFEKICHKYPKLSFLPSLYKN